VVSWGQFDVACARSRWASEVLVGSGMAGMGDVLPAPPRHSPGTGVFGCMIGEAIHTVRLWRDRYARECPAGLADRRRSGRPPTFTPVHRRAAAEVELPGPGRQRHRPGHRHPDPGHRDPPDPCRRRHQTPAVPVVAVSTRPGLRRQGQPGPSRAPGLYSRVRDGSPPGDDEYEISCDEKTSIQHPARLAGSRLKTPEGLTAQTT